MNFYRMDEDFFDDGMFNLDSFWGIPGIICDVCGNTWGSADVRLRVKKKEGMIRRERGKPVSWEKFLIIRKEVSEELHLMLEDVVPGADIGIVRLKSIGGENVDFTMPYAYTIIVSKKMKMELIANRFSGIEFYPLIIDEVYSEGYFEIVISGNAGVIQTDPEIQILEICQQCSKIYYSQVGPKRCVDIGQWDGSDFSRFTGPCRGYIVVVERVKDFLENSGMIGFKFKKLE